MGHHPHVTPPNGVSASNRRPGGPCSRSIKCLAELPLRDPQRERQLLASLVTQRHLAPLESSNQGGADPCRCRELGLRESGENAPVTWESVVLRDGDQRLDPHAENPRNVREAIHLRRLGAGLPVVNRRRTHRGGSCQFTLRKPRSQTLSAERISLKATRDAATHSPAQRRVVMCGHFASSALLSSSDVTIEAMQ